MAISPREFAVLLKQASAMTPQPGVQIEAEMGIACSRLEQVRDQVDQAFDCRHGGNCLEGQPDLRPEPAMLRE